jgi:hypothetical protein
MVNNDFVSNVSAGKINFAGGGYGSDVDIKIAYIPPEHCTKIYNPNGIKHGYWAGFLIFRDFWETWDEENEFSYQIPQIVKNISRVTPDLNEFNNKIPVAFIKTDTFGHPEDTPYGRYCVYDYEINMALEEFSIDILPED